MLASESVAYANAGRSGSLQAFYPLMELTERVLKLIAALWPLSLTLPQSSDSSMPFWNLRFTVSYPVQKGVVSTIRNAGVAPGFHETVI